ncbi:MAG TPA: AAA family ATPase [Trebonia sp.]|nr:AAA family ATPase [Trebonia sp.]
MTARFGHGLVIGKFYPPHLGHVYLITAAAAACDQVTVLVMAARRETVPLPERVSWLRDTFAESSNRGDVGRGDAGRGDTGRAASDRGDGYRGGRQTRAEVAVCGVRCDAPVDYGDASVWAAQVAVMRAALARDGRPPVNAVFSSEPYGEELATRLGASHVPVDPARAAVPVSASLVRGDLYGWWDRLVPAARAGLATRVVVLGAESTGTTTVARLLAEHYRGRGGAWAGTPCVPEYGRQYTMIKWDAARAAARAAGRPEPSLEEITWDQGDFDVVAREQTRTENLAARGGAPLVICDTDAFATAVWERRYLGERARGLQAWARDELPRHDLYLLTSHEEVPWHDDGLREGDLAVRAAMTDWFAAALARAGHSWVLLTGPLEERVRLAVRSVDLALEDRSLFGASITESSTAGAGCAR